MPFYESTFITRPDLSAQQAEALAERFAAIVTDNGGTIAKTEYWGLRTLAYRIKKHRKGHYTLFGIEALPEVLKEMERNMRIEEDVLRYLTVKVDAIDPEPSPLLHSRGRDDKRDERLHDAGRARYGRGARDSWKGKPDRETDAEAKPEAKPEDRVEAEPEAEAKTEDRVEAEPEAEAKTEAKTEDRGEAKPEAKTEDRGEAKPEDAGESKE